NRRRNMSVATGWCLLILHHRGIVSLVLIQIRAHLVDLADSNIFLEAEIVAHEVLKDDTDRLPHRAEVVFAQVDVIQKNAPLGWVVQPGQQFCESCLAGTILTDESDALARPKLEADM